MGTIEKLVSPVTPTPLEEKEETGHPEQEAIQQETLAQVQQLLAIPGMDLAADKEKLLALITNKKVHSGVLPMMSTAETRTYINKCPELLARILARQNVDKIKIDSIYAENQSILKNDSTWQTLPVESAYVAILMTYAKYFDVLEENFNITISSPTDPEKSTHAAKSTDLEKSKHAAKIIFKLEQGDFAHLAFGGTKKVA